MKGESIARPILDRAVVLATIYLLLAAVGGALLAEIALHPARKPLSAADSARARSLAARFGARVQVVRIAAGDGSRLSAWYLLPDRPAADAVIILHGVRDNRA